MSYETFSKNVYSSLHYWLNGKESVCSAGEVGLIPVSGRFPRERTGNILQYFCLGNPMDSGTWWATI